MKRLNKLIIGFSLFVIGCSGNAANNNDLGGGGSGGTDLSMNAGDGGGSGPDLAGPRDMEMPGPANNVAPMIVDNGPAGTESVDVPFVSVTICVPGTSTCQTIDHVSVDTGSSGLRVVASVLNSITLPQKSASNGQPMAECFQFADGYTWGSVRLADVKISGELAANIPIQLVGDPAYATVPHDCSTSGASEDTVLDFGANGLLGLNQIIPDCGDYCADTQNIAKGSYYSCASPATCASVAVANAQQVANPAAAFAADANGAILHFPSVASGGAASLPGALIFGIGTQANNGLGSASVLTVDVNGNFATNYKGNTLDTSFLDSGTNSYSFNDSSIPQCSGNSAGFYCPAMELNLTATNTGRNSVSATVAFRVGNTDTLFNNANAYVYDDLAGPGDNTSFDWGFPFFIGRDTFVAWDGASTPGGSGPYFAW